MIGTSLDKGVELDAVAMLKGEAPKKAAEVVEQAAAGEKVSAVVAPDGLSAGAPSPTVRWPYVRTQREALNWNAPQRRSQTHDGTTDLNRTGAACGDPPGVSAIGGRLLQIAVS